MTHAARAIGIPEKRTNHKFVSDTDKHCRAAIRHQYKNRPTDEWPIIYEDVMKVDHSTTPKVDVFGAGPPCQPHSNEGLRLGAQDPRSQVGNHVIKYIEVKQPVSFMLENVPQLATGRKSKKYFKKLCNRLSNIIDEATGLAMYDIHQKVLDTAEHGIPQRRKRLYIVGVAKAKKTQPFSWPVTLPMPRADLFLDKLPKKAMKPVFPSTQTRLTNLVNGLAKIKDRGDDPWKDGLGRVKHVIAPCE